MSSRLFWVMRQRPETIAARIDVLSDQLTQQAKQITKLEATVDAYDNFLTEFNMCGYEPAKDGRPACYSINATAFDKDYECLTALKEKQDE